MALTTPLFASLRGERHRRGGVRARARADGRDPDRRARRARPGDARRDAQGAARTSSFRPSRAAQAYEDHPLPIGHGQTISQPYIVAFMTEAAGLRGGETVLEIGTGSGYQAAVLCQIAARVYTIEIVAPLAEAFGGAAGAARLRERVRALRRRLPGLAGGRALRRDPGHRRRAPDPRAAQAAAQGRRPAWCCRSATTGRSSWS